MVSKKTSKWIIVLIVVLSFVITEIVNAQFNVEIEVIDAYCTEPGNATIVIENIGPTAISSIDVKQTAPSDDTASDWSGALEPGKTISYVDTCIGKGARNCSYELTPENGSSVTTSVYCIGTAGSYIEIVDSYCCEGCAEPYSQAVIVIKNIGTNVIDVNDITLLQTSPSSIVSPTWDKKLVQPTDTVTVKDICEGSGGRSCVYKVIPPAGESQDVTIYCTTGVEVNCSNAGFRIYDYSYNYDKDTGKLTLILENTRSVSLNGFTVTIFTDGTEIIFTLDESLPAQTIKTFYLDIGKIGISKIRVTSRECSSVYSEVVVSPPIPPPISCFSDEDCMWCGEECILKSEAIVCPLLLPPKGYECKCIEGKCTKVKTEVDKTKLLEILILIEQLKTKFDRLKTISQSITDYYSGIGDTAKATCWNEVTLMFEASIMKIENIKTEINKVKENPTQEDLQKIKDTVSDLRANIDGIINKIFEC